MLITVNKTEQAFTQNGAEYLKVHGVDPEGKEVTKSIFDSLKAAWPILEKGLGQTFEFKMVKKGQFWNVQNVIPYQPNQQPQTSPVQDSSLVKEAQKVGVKTDIMTKEEWAEKDKTTRKSIERQKSLELAVEMAKIKTTDDSKKVIATAKIFENYLEKGE